MCSRGDDAVGRGSANAIGRGRATDDRGDRSRSRDRSRSPGPELFTIVWRYWGGPVGRDHRVLRRMTVRELKEDIAFMHNHHADRIDLYIWRFDPPHTRLWPRQTMAEAGIRERDLLLVRLLSYEEASDRLFPLGW